MPKIVPVHGDVAYMINGTKRDIRDWSSELGHEFFLVELTNREHIAVVLGIDGNWYEVETATA